MISIEKRDPYGKALAELRRLASLGAFSPGAPLVVGVLADRIGLSPTPVREALARLAGEGLFIRQKGRGYFYPADAAPFLIDLYELQRAYLHAALTLCFRGGGGLQKAGAEIAPEDGPLALFVALVQQSGNEALIAAHGRVTDRLSSAVKVERAVNPQWLEASEAMFDAMKKAQVDRLLQLIEGYHKGRCAMAAAVARLLDASSIAISR